MFVCVVIVRVLNDALAYFEGQIQTSECGISLFEIFDDAQGVKIVVERESVLAHSGVEGLLSGMAERRMADVVNEGESFGEIDVEIQGSGYRARDLRDFQRMRQAIAEVIAVASRKDLRFGFEAAEGTGVNDAVAVALVVVAIRVVRLRIPTSAGLFEVHRVGRRHGESIAVPSAVLRVRTEIVDC